MLIYITYRYTFLSYSHEELIAKGDHYAGMWHEQITKQKVLSVNNDEGIIEDY